MPLLRLDATVDPPPRLGWNTWLEHGVGGPRRTEDAGESVFEAEIIEAQSVAPAEAHRPGLASERFSKSTNTRNIATKEPVA